MIHIIPILLFLLFTIPPGLATEPITYSGPDQFMISEPVDDVIYYSDSGNAEFTSRVPLHTFTGESHQLTGMIDLRENIIDFFLDLNTLKTGIGRRDRDMFRTLNVTDHPFAEFTGSLETSFDKQSAGRQIVFASGEFTINGITRRINIEGFLQKQGDDLHLEAEWTLLLDDYDIDPPGILFYRVNNEQEIRIEVLLNPHDRDTFSTQK